MTFKPSLRNLNVQPKKIEVENIDHGKKVMGTIISHDKEKIVVDLGNNLHLTMWRHQKIPNMFIGNMAGLEFQAKFV